MVTNRAVLYIIGLLVLPTFFVNAEIIVISAFVLLISVIIKNSASILNNALNNNLTTITKNIKQTFKRPDITQISQNIIINVAYETFVDVNWSILRVVANDFVAEQLQIILERNQEAKKGINVKV